MLAPFLLRTFKAQLRNLLLITIVDLIRYSFPVSRNSTNLVVGPMLERFSAFDGGEKFAEIYKSVVTTSITRPPSSKHHIPFLNEQGVFRPHLGV